MSKILDFEFEKQMIQKHGDQYDLAVALSYVPEDLADRILNGTLTYPEFETIMDMRCLFGDILDLLTFYLYDAYPDYLKQAAEAIEAEIDAADLPDMSDMEIMRGWYQIRKAIKKTTGHDIGEWNWQKDIDSQDKE